MIQLQEKRHMAVDMIQYVDVEADKNYRIASVLPFFRWFSQAVMNKLTYSNECYIDDYSNQYRKVAIHRPVYCYGDGLRTIT